MLVRKSKRIQQLEHKVSLMKMERARTRTRLDHCEMRLGLLLKHLNLTVKMEPSRTYLVRHMKEKSDASTD